MEGNKIVWDKAKSEERMEALMKGKKPDRVPVLPFMPGHIGCINGYSIAEIFGNAEKSFHAQTRAREFYGYDGSNYYMVAAFGGWEFGGEVRFPGKEGGGIVVTKRPVQNEEEAWQLEVPEDVLQVGTVPIQMEFSRLQEKHGMPISVRLGTPFGMAGNILGLENFMINLIDNPELVHSVLRKCTDFVIRLGECWIREFGAERIQPYFGAATESNKLISPNHFQEFALPYLKEVVGHFASKGVMGFISHICSEQTMNLPYYAEVPWPGKSIFSFGPEVSLKTAGEWLPNHIIAGHPDPIILLQGTPEEALVECRKSVEEGMNIPGGFILMPGCDVPYNAPPVNVYQMIKAARLFGQY